MGRIFVESLKKQLFAILYGSNDNLIEFDVVSNFVERYRCKLDILEWEALFPYRQTIEWIQGKIAPHNR
ncbi:MAG TPA: hypothetical protein VIM29_11500 [Bacillota bacterium]